MAIKGQSITVSYRAWDTSANAYKTGDVANHSLSIVKDGGARAATTNSPAEIDATNMPGAYKITLTNTEMTANVVTLAGKSSTANIVITGLTDIITEQGVLPGGTTAGSNNGLPLQGAAVPNANAGANGGLPTVDANNNIHGVVPGTGTGQINPSGGKVPATIASGDYSGNTVQTGDAFARLGAPAGASTAADIAAVKSSVGSPMQAGSQVVLSSAGLDQISVSDPGGISSQTTFPKIMVALWRRYFKKSTMTASQLKTYADDGATVNTTQATSDDGTTQTVGTST